MSEVLVIGHKNPDNDAICSAIAYAEFKRRTGMMDAVAARCGEINDRIDFTLKTFGVAPPKFVSDVSPKVRDVMQENVIAAEPDTTVAQAMAMMDAGNLRALPVLNPNRTCSGLISLFKISRLIFPSANGKKDTRRLRTSLGGLAQTLGGSFEFGVRPLDEEELIMVIGAMSVEAFGRRLSERDPSKVVVIVGDRWDVQNLAIRERVRALIITGALKLEGKTLDAAKEAGVAVISSPHDTATTGGLCRAAMPVKHVLMEDYLAFDQDERLDKAQATAAATSASAFPVFDKNKRVVGVLSKSDFLKSVDRKLILVDHNELSQAVNGADKVQIIEVIDHHRIGTLTTAQPILFRNEPLGSTSSIVADCFFRYGVKLPKKIAGLLLAGLVTDTLNLTSPTATAQDAEILKRLEKIAEVDATNFTEQLFASGSVLISKPAAEAISTDCKIYNEAGMQFSVAQIEEISFDQFQARKDEVVNALEQYRSANGFFFSTLLVTDVTRQNSLLVVVGSPGFLNQIKYPELEPGIYDFAGIVSRKKQLLPFLTSCLSQAADANE
jgi:manganese-dependent inorganic pyrophosphatase